MKKFYTILMMAAAMVACTKGIDQPSEPETYTLSIKASKDDVSTKALSLSGSTLNATWAEGEKVTVYMMVATTPILIGTLEPDPTSISSDGTECTLIGELEAETIDNNGGLNSGDGLVLRFSGSIGDGGMTPEQDGTLATIQNYYDVATADVTVNSVTDVPGGSKKHITASDANFENQQAIVKFTLLDKADGTTLLTPTTLTVNDGTSDIATATIPATTYTTNGDGILYVAIPPVSGDLTITASDGTFNYKYTKTGASFTAGQYYNITVKMIKYTVDLSAITDNYEAQDGDILTGGFSDDAYVTIPDGATVTLNGVNIAAPYESDHAAIHCLGSATIILAGSSYNNVRAGDSSDYPAVYVPSGSTLTISGTGELCAESHDSNYAACIGGGKDINCGNIVINGGTIDATSTGHFAAGIGSGYNGSCGTITISGGTIEAQGGERGAGIGTGNCGFCGNITISGDTVNATGGNYAAGIGTGDDGSCGTITISGGTIEAHGGEYSSCIGRAYFSSSCGDITIDNTITDVMMYKYNPSAEYYYILVSNTNKVTIDGVDNLTDDQLSIGVDSDHGDIFPNLYSEQGYSWHLWK